MALRIFGTPGGSSGGNSGGGGGTPNTGPQSYTHRQMTAASVWRFTHNLPFDPGQPRIVDAAADDIEWFPDVDYNPSTKAFTITFPVPVAGTATVS